VNARLPLVVEPAEVVLPIGQPPTGPAGFARSQDFVANSAGCSS